MLRSFGVLPSSEEARKMTDRDYLLCALHLILDEEERLDMLCPACRVKAEEERCPACGEIAARSGAAINASFDAQRFERMKRGDKS